VVEMDLGQMSQNRSSCGLLRNMDHVLLYEISG
jgi:hypothetical protein